MAPIQQKEKPVLQNRQVAERNERIHKTNAKSNQAKQAAADKSSENSKLGTPSSFLIFFYENRIFIKKQFKGLSNNQIAKKAGELWK